MSIVSSGITLNTAYNVTGDLTGNLIFQSNGTTEAVRIDTNQNVGIGTTNPAQKLEVNGWVRTGIGASALGGLELPYYSGSASSRTWRLRTDISAYGDFSISQATTQGGATFDTKIYIDASGNVGIGTTAPQQRLGIKPATNVPQLYLIQDNVANDGYKLFADSSAGYLSFLRTSSGSDTERMRIDSSGNFIVGGTINSYGGKLTVDGDLIARGNKIIGINGTSVAAGTFAFRNSVGVQKSAIGSYYNIADEGNIEFINGTTTNAVLTSSGNVGIGTSSPTNRLTVNGGTGSTPTIRLNGGASADDNALISSKYNLVLGCNADGNISSRAITFVNSTTEYVRIDSSGNLLVNATSNGGNGKFYVTNTNDCIQAYTTGASGFGVVCRTAYTSSNGNLQAFVNSSGSIVGSITTNNSTTSFNTSSDYRLKENIAPMTGCLAKVLALKPVTYKWKESGLESQGFIAHELAEICSDAVNGTKDQVDADGNPVYQGIDTSFLVATLTAAIQELSAKNDTQAETINAQSAALAALTARIVAIESKAWQQ
jgi:hypothetical protein